MKRGEGDFWTIYQAINVGRRDTVEQRRLDCSFRSRNSFSTPSPLPLFFCESNSREIEKLSSVQESMLFTNNYSFIANVSLNFRGKSCDRRNSRSREIKYFFKMILDSGCKSKFWTTIFDRVIRSFFLFFFCESNSGEIEKLSSVEESGSMLFTIE